MAVFHLIGWISGNLSENRASDTLKGPRAVRLKAVHLSWEKVKNVET